MKIIVNFLVTIAFTWPAIVAGYIFEALVTGFVVGRLWSGEHSDAAVNKFCKKDAK